jgi:hypothetical protein
MKSIALLWCAAGAAGSIASITRTVPPRCAAVAQHPHTVAVAEVVQDPLEQVQVRRRHRGVEVPRHRLPPAGQAGHVEAVICHLLRLVQ